ncbi:MAG: DUF4135 domain-containing protein [Acidobacteriota bacterium]|nr:DUF4135 domain-containing protein [Acidobacteriota bacterium]
MTTIDLLGARFPVPSLFRLPMYYHYLAETLKLLDQWADEHPVCAPALRDPSFAAELARELDAYAAQQMVADINRFFVPTFRGVSGQLAGLPQVEFLQYCYFRFCLVEKEDPHGWDGKHLNAYQKEFAVHLREGFAGLDCFRPVPEELLHPITLLVLRHLSESLWNGLARLCRRLNHSRDDLGFYFFDGDRPELLACIQTTGSRRHKGGFRTLLLHLRLASGRAASLLYKPFDLEKDFLFMGDLQHAWRVLDSGELTDPAVIADLKWLKNKTLSGSSLGELCNSLGTAALPTCKILPCLPGSQMLADEAGRLPEIREAHGFMEYLEPDESEPADIQQQLGRLQALAWTFGLEDCRDLIVHGGRLYMVDLENQALGRMASPRDTGIGRPYREPDPHYLENFTLTGGYQGLKVLEPEPSTDREEPAAEAGALTDARDQMLHLIGQNAATFLNWLNCLRDVVVRVSPYPPETLDAVIAAIHRHDTTYHKDGAERVIDVQGFKDELESRATLEIARWTQEKAALLVGSTNQDPTDAGQRDQLFWEIHPAFSIYLSRAILLDGVRGDLPAFYHRLGTRDLLGSDGSIIRFAIHGMDNAALFRALTSLYGNDWQAACPYFPRDSLTVLVEQVRGLAAHSVVA